MPELSKGAVWFSSYPKSGNTWLRLLLEAYHRNGLLAINDVRVVSSDSGASLIRGVCPIPLKDLGFNGQMLLRPAAILNLLARMHGPAWMVKTHFANIQPEGLPHCIPKEFTHKAVYVVRDPRSVLLSMSKYFGFSTEKAVAAMNDESFSLGNDDEFACQLVSSWTNHVASWVGEKRYPVHVVKYEDMIADASKELTEVLEFLDEDVDPAIVRKAVDTCELSNLRKEETENGFKHVPLKSGTFFNEGGTRWREELGPKWIAKIEEDHGEVMRTMGYLDSTVTELKTRKS